MKPEWFESWFGEEYIALYPHRNAAEAEHAVQLIERYLDPTAPKRVLDLACGTGDLCRTLADAGYRPIGADFSAGMLHAATTPAPLVRADALCLPFADGAFDGEWRTSLGTVTLKQSGPAVTGTYGDAAQFTLKGAVRGKELRFEYQEGNASGEARWTLDDAGNSFHGGFQVRGGQAGERARELWRQAFDLLMQLEGLERAVEAAAQDLDRDHDSAAFISLKTERDTLRKRLNSDWAHPEEAVRPVLPH